MKGMIMLAMGLFASQQVLAEQGAFAVDKSVDEWRFEVAWTDASGRDRQVDYSMPAALIESDLAVPLRFQVRDANAAIVQAINDYGNATKGVQIKAVQRGKKVAISGRARSRKAMKKAKSDLKVVQRRAERRYLKANGFTKLKGRIIPNHAQYAQRYAERVEPLAVALGSAELKRRAFAKRALSFVQSIPYEQGRNGRDKGFRLPLSVLARNKGDCDSKATLYLALMKAAHPSLDSVFVYIKGHAFVGLGLRPAAKDVTFEAAGRTWVLVEPVGPALSPIGQGARRSERKARRGAIEVRRVRDG